MFLLALHNLRARTGRTLFTVFATRASATTFSEKIRAENGVARAVEIIERHAQTRPHAN